MYFKLFFADSTDNGNQNKSGSEAAENGISTKKKQRKKPKKSTSAENTTSSKDTENSDSVNTNSLASRRVSRLPGQIKPKR